MIPFNIPPFWGNETKYIEEVIRLRKICGDGKFTKLCNDWIVNNTNVSSALLTTSCTHALEMSALLLNIQPGDEVIMPSFTFVSTANAFVLRGAHIVFVDIRPDTMNINEMLIEAAITNRTKAIVPVHYAGVGCEMDTIISIAKKYNIAVVEDAAQGVMASYKGKALGSIGDFGTFSFHETKNYSMGEGGALLINDVKWTEQSEIIREKGTNRSIFLRGQIDKYTWMDWGSSYLPSELNAAYLYAQLEHATEINDNRIKTWNKYQEAFLELENLELLKCPTITKDTKHNAHMYYIKLKHIEERSEFIEYLKSKNIYSVFHYIPLHSAPAGKRFGHFSGEDKYTTSESEKLVRLPLYYNLSELDLEYIIDSVKSFWTK